MCIVKKKIIIKREKIEKQKEANKTRPQFHPSEISTVIYFSAPTFLLPFIPSFLCSFLPFSLPLLIIYLCIPGSELTNCDLGQLRFLYADSTRLSVIVQIKQVTMNKFQNNAH